MGLTNPPAALAKPFQEVFKEGEPFILDGIRTVKAKTDYGDGEMILFKVRGQEYELSIWGVYLLNQASAATSSDFGKRYILATEVVDGFSRRPVKLLKLHDDTEPPADF